jgi:hypothetical protein
MSESLAGGATIVTVELELEADDNEGDDAEARMGRDLDREEQWAGREDDIRRGISGRGAPAVLELGENRRSCGCAILDD